MAFVLREIVATLLGRVPEEARDDVVQVEPVRSACRGIPDEYLERHLATLPARSDQRPTTTPLPEAILLAQEDRVRETFLTLPRRV